MRRLAVCLPPVTLGHLPGLRESLWEAGPSSSLACVGEDDDGPVFMLILELLDQVDQVGILDLLRHQQVALV